MAEASLLKTYYSLTKPGIIYGNAVTTVAGFFLASKGHFNALIFISVLLGSSLVMASGCVFNNYLERDIDAKMKRTKKRASVLGTISPSQMLIFATLLGLVGFATLILYTNLLTAFIGLVGLTTYVLLYTPAKRRTVYSTLIGSVSGAVPPVAGYCAVTNHFDGAALILFLLLVLWQMPHFYAIAMFRIEDYKAANLPVLPITHGLTTTKIQILSYVGAFLVAAVALTLFGYTGYIYFALAVILSAFWLWLGIKGFKTTEPTLWARQMFRFSLIILTVLSIVISLNAVLI